MATLNTKFYDPPTVSSAARQQHGQMLQAGAGKTARVRPLSSLASSLRNAAAVAIDAVMGRYDR